MKTSLKIDTLFERAEQYKSQALDLVAPMTRINVLPDAQELEIGDHVGSMTDHAFAQLCTALQVPTAYAIRCRDSEYEKIAEPNWPSKIVSRAPMISEHLNSWLQHPKQDANKLVRGLEINSETIASTIEWRAFLSDRYFAIHSIDALQAAMSVCNSLKSKYGAPTLASGDVTPDRMFAKITFPGMQREIKSRRRGDVVRWGLMIENNEIGLGKIRARGFADFLWCTNGIVSTRTLLDANGMPLQFERRHVGSKLGLEADAGIQWGDETRAAARDLQLSTLRDTISHILHPDTFEAEVRIFENAAANDVRVSDGEKSIKKLAKDNLLSDEESKQILHAFLSDNDPSQYGLGQAICSDRVARTLSYDRATKFEHLAYNVIAMPAREWSSLALAA
jgi:hypothetical protein